MPHPRHWRRVYGRLAAAATVASLGYFGFFYGIQLAEPAPAPATLARLARGLTWDLALFAAFAAHHSLMARARAKRWMARLLPSEFERATYVWAASLLLVATCWAWARLPGLLYATAPPWSFLGYGVQAGGLLLFGRAVSRLHLSEFVGLRQLREARLARPDQARRESLDEGGAYRWVRHPTYLGGLLMLWGVPVMTADRLVVAGLTTGYVLIAVSWEERSLEETHGDAYRTYASRVRWRILPGIY